MNQLLSKLGLDSTQPNPGGFDGEWFGSGPTLDVFTPIDGSKIASVRQINAAEYDRVARRAAAAFDAWRMVPAPQRGEVIRQLGDRLRTLKKELGALVTLEVGKITAEGEGEVQEMIDICDFACGLSRQLYGQTMHSERARHRMYEQWHPLGVVGIISAFNFPVAVWSWNSALAAVCGDSTIWKPAPKTPLTAIATIRIAEQACRAAGVDPAIFSLAFGDLESVGEPMIRDRRIPLVSATGSCRMGRRVGQVVADRMGRSLLELGGNNAIIVTAHADLNLATRAIVFGAAGTAGQRCTTTRRLIVHRSVKADLLARLQQAYATIRIGDPRKPETLMGPLINADSVKAMQTAIASLKSEGGRVLYGGEVLSGPEYPGGCYVRPCIAEARGDMKIVCEETFAPILYVIEYGSATRPADNQTLIREVHEAIAVQNAVPQGLSSAIFTHHVIEAEEFLAHSGSDCGIANVNIGTSGAEIGGAFGGEKETGGGRESGSDSWKAYMRRQTNTINWGTELPLAQGIKFGE